MEGRKLARESKFGLQVPDLLKLYQLMVLTREFETRVAKIYRQQSIVETPHLCIGEEAIGVGSCYGLRRDDFVLPTFSTNFPLFHPRYAPPTIAPTNVITRASPMSIKVFQIFPEITSHTGSR